MRNMCCIIWIGNNHDHMKLVFKLLSFPSVQWNCQPRCHLKNHNQLLLPQCTRIMNSINYKQKRWQWNEYVINPLRAEGGNETIPQQTRNLIKSYCSRTWNLLKNACIKEPATALFWTLPKKTQSLQNMCTLEKKYSARGFGNKILWLCVYV